MPVTRIKNNQITDLTVNAASKLQDFSITSTKIANNFTYGSDFTIAGNLTVQGNVTAIDTTDLVVEDPLILLAKDQTGAPSLDIGFIGERGDELNAAFIWDESAGQFVTAFTADSVTNTTISINSYASLKTLDLESANVTITGTLDVTGNVTIANINIGENSTIDAGNNRVSNVAEPVSGSDAATKDYVDSASSSGFTIEDDLGANTVVSGGDTLLLLGTADEISVLITDTDEITFALPSNVTIADSLTVTNAANAASFNATGNITGGNLVTAGDVTTATVTASGNIDGGNLVTAGDVTTATVTASGNVNGGNLTTAGDVTTATVTASGNVSGGNLVTAGDVTTATVTASGNVSGGNLVTAGDVTTATVTASSTITATGNVSGGNLVTAGDVTTATVTASSTITATGNVSGGNITTAGDVTTATVTASGNVSGGNLVTAGDVTTATVTASGNVNGGNLTTAGDVTTATVTASGNVAGGNLTTAGIVSATGNITGGNLTTAGDVTTATVTASGNISADNVLTDTVESSGTLNFTAVSGDIVFSATGNIDAGNVNILNVADPVSDSDAATKGYVDSVAQGLDVKASCLVATAGNLDAATGGTVSYNNGSSGVGATLTTTGTFTTIDGVSVATAGTRVLVKDETTQAWNGIYVYTNSTTLTRATDFDNGSPSGEIPGGFTFIEQGSTYADTGWVCTTNAPVTVGTTAITFSQFSGAGQYTAGDGLTLTGTVFSVNVDGTTIAIAADTLEVPEGANLPNVDIGDGTASSLDVTGNIIAANLNANSGVTATTVSASGNVSGGNITTAGDVTTATVTASGNVSGGNLTTAGAVDATGNVTGGNLIAVGDVSGATLTISGNIDGANLNATSAVTAGTTVTAVGNVSGGNITTAGDVTTATVTASGNVSGGNLVTAGDVTTATVTASGNIDGGNLVTAGDVTTATVTASGNVSGGNLVTAGDVTTATVTASGNVSGGNLVTAGDVTTATVTASGNVSGGNLVTAGDVTTATVTASSTITATGNVSGGNITTAGDVTTATVTASGNVSGGNITTAGDVTTATVTASGNVSGGNLVTAGDVTTATVTASGNVSGGNIAITGIADLGNIRIEGDNITNKEGNDITINAAGADINLIVSGDNQANLLVVDAGSDTVLIGTGTATTGAALKIGTADSMLVPVGNTAQRPGTGVTGMLRFNTTEDTLEFYDSDSWTGISSDFTVIVADEFTGDGSTLAFTLSQSSTTAGTIVSINGVVQIPTTAYAVSGTTLTFTEAPGSTDVIDARILSTTSIVSVANISNSSGNAVIAASEVAAEVLVTGDLIPSANLTYDLGAPTAYWSNLYLAGNTIFLGDLQLKAVSSSEFGVFTSDGVTTANLDFANSAIDTTTVTASGNISGGNILSDGYFFANGDPFGSSYGDANVTTLLGSFGSNAISTTGNISGGNLSGTNIVGTLTTATQTNITSVGTLSSLSVTGNVSGGNLVTSALVSAADGLFTNDIQVDSLGVGTAASGTTGEIRATNNVTAFYSDRRLKTNIQPLENALDKVCAISGVTFQSNDVAAQHGYTDPKTHVGVIAQEIQAVLPQIVVPAPFDIGVRDDGTEYSVSGENYMTVQYDKLVPLLIEAIKGLKAELDQLKNTKE